MNELTSYCSQALLERLANDAPCNSGDVVSLAEARIIRDVRKLSALGSRILRWRYGLGCEQLTDAQIAARLRLQIDTVAEIGDEALLELGFALVSVPAAA